MRKVWFGFVAAMLLLSGWQISLLRVQADQASDFAALLNSITTVALPSGNVPGAVAAGGVTCCKLLITLVRLARLERVIF